MDVTGNLAGAVAALPAEMKPIVDHVMDRLADLESNTIVSGMALEVKLAADIIAAESRLLEALGPRMDTLNATLVGFLSLAQSVINGRFVPGETALK